MVFTASLVEMKSLTAKLGAAGGILLVYVTHCALTEILKPKFYNTIVFLRHILYSYNKYILARNKSIRC